MLDEVCTALKAQYFYVQGKRGDMGLEEIIKIVFFLLVLVVVVGGAYLLFFRKGGRIMTSVRNIFRFGS